MGLPSPPPPPAGDQDQPPGGVCAHAGVGHGVGLEGAWVGPGLGSTEEEGAREFMPLGEYYMIETCPPLKPSFPLPFPPQTPFNEPHFLLPFPSLSCF